MPIRVPVDLLPGDLDGRVDAHDGEHPQECVARLLEDQPDPLGVEAITKADQGADAAHVDEAHTRQIDENQPALGSIDRHQLGQILRALAGDLAFEEGGLGVMRDRQAAGQCQVGVGPSHAPPRWGPGRRPPAAGRRRVGGSCVRHVGTHFPHRRMGETHPEHRLTSRSV
jgi:hypothetical protein